MEIENNKKSLPIPPTVIASGTKQSRQTLLRHPDDNQDLVGLGKIPDQVRNDEKGEWNDVCFFTTSS